MKLTRTSSRKKEHVELVISKDVAFKGKTTGFERWDFVHNALPEFNFADVDTTSTFLGKKIALPLIISSMTGGYGDAERINRQLAEVCGEKQLAMGVGSQRQVLENETYIQSYRAAREAAPEIPLIGNLGAAEVAKLESVTPILRLAEMIRADGFAIHLNPLQEFLQPEGSTEFHHVLTNIEMLVRELALPVIVKEIGAGISMSVATRLLNAGVTIIDIAGAGGTSWAGVEILRRTGHTTKHRNGAGEKNSYVQEFWDWGIPTVDALRQVCSLKQQHKELTIIASGGITCGITMAKSIAFGADLTASARPMLKALEAKGKKGLIEVIHNYEMGLRGAMFLTGSRTIQDLQHQQLVLKG
ncbi:MAG: type 2 isopentenyl-diphosphate Delta-isomerase [bacterium]